MALSIRCNGGPGVVGVAYTSEQPAYNQYLALSGSRIQKTASWGGDCKEVEM